jgi:hypothetical protein
MADSIEFTHLQALALLLLKFSLLHLEPPLSILLLVAVVAVEPTWEVEAVEAVSFKVRLLYQPLHIQLLSATEA